MKKNYQDLVVSAMSSIPSLDSICIIFIDFCGISVRTVLHIYFGETATLHIGLKFTSAGARKNKHVWIASMKDTSITAVLITLLVCLL